MRRLLALIGAVVMIGGALLVRGAIDDNKGGGKDNGGSMRLLCATELKSVCDELDRADDIDVDDLPVGDVMDNSDVLLEYDGWLTFERSAERVRDARQRASLDRLTEDASDPIARSPVVVAIAEERAAVLAEHCGGDITWRCIGDVAGTRWQSFGGSASWGAVKPAHADPAETGEGLVIIGQEAAHFFESTDLSRDNFDEDEFLGWFTQLERSTTLDSNAFEILLNRRSATYDVVAALEAKTDQALARRDDVRLIYPAPVATADVVFVPIVGGDDDLDDVVTGDDGRDALVAAGFRVDDDGEPPLPSKDGLPSAGVLEALLQTWREVTG